jgi:hypothetical protein
VGPYPSVARGGQLAPAVKGQEDFSPLAGSPRGPSSARTPHARRFRFLFYSSPSHGSGGSDSAFFPRLQWPLL